MAGRKTLVSSSGRRLRAIGRPVASKKRSQCNKTRWCAKTLRCVHGPRRIPRVSETCFAALHHHAARSKRGAGCEHCGCLAAPSCLQSRSSQGKSGSGRPLQPSNDGERRARRRPVRYVRPERSREARRAGAHRRRTGSTKREVPEGERERLRVHERLWGCHVRGRCPWYVPSRHTPSPRICPKRDGAQLS